MTDRKPSQTHEKNQISACVITHNEEAKIRRCLESLTWCDEIVAVDSFSTDRTLAICREYTDRVYQHEWRGYIGQRNLIREMASCPWVLLMDADEVLSPELRQEIKQEFEGNVGAYIGYQFPRQVYYLGKWIKHGEWYPDIKLRLFKKELGYSCGQEPHDYVVVDGPIKTFRSPLWHYTYDDITDHLETMNRFSTISARAKFEDGSRFKWGNFLVRPVWRFIKGMILKGGLLDGQRGFLIAAINFFGVSMKYAKLWEIELKQKQLSNKEDNTRVSCKTN
ncbi:MAG: glycosyltransferase [Kiritimatiellae bacterium]|nr:glycosyltransferase [Kiritimatiellia bacterium]